MQVLIDRACGLDVHKASITACVITRPNKEEAHVVSGRLYSLEGETTLKLAESRTGGLTFTIPARSIAMLRAGETN